MGQPREGKPKREGKDEKIARERGGHTHGRRMVIVKMMTPRMMNKMDILMMVMRMVMLQIMTLGGGDRKSTNYTIFSCCRSGCVHFCS